MREPGGAHVALTDLAHEFLAVDDFAGALGVRCRAPGKAVPLPPDGDRSLATPGIGLGQPMLLRPSPLLSVAIVASSRLERVPRVVEVDHALHDRR